MTKKIRKKLLGFEVGMTCYSTLEKDEEDIIIPFVVSLYITSTKIVELLPGYLECLRRDECPEVLGVNLDMMTSTAYWMKNNKLKHDMEALNDLTLHERDLEFAYKGFKPATTLELYQAIKKNVDAIVAMLSEVHRLLMADSTTLYGNFYRQQKSLYDERKVVAAYEQWQREVGVVTFDILVDKQALEIAEFLKRKILRHSRVPSKREIRQVDVDTFREHLPIGYEVPDEFQKCLARFMRVASSDGDILRINDNSYGKYLHQFYYQLSDDEQQALIELGMMLDLIHHDMEELMSHEVNSVPTIHAMASAVEQTVAHGNWWASTAWAVVYRIYQMKGYAGSVSQFVREVEEWPWQKKPEYECNYDAVCKPIRSGKLAGTPDGWVKNGASSQYAILGQKLLNEFQKLELQFQK